MKRLNVVLVGNPNVGKTSLLNHIAGTTLKVGNWAGTTVEKKEGRVLYDRYEIDIVDLPGIYSLEPFSEAERIAKDYILSQKPDVVVNVIDTTNMERDLLLTVELLEMNIPMVIALNMWDEAQRLGIEVDVSKLEELLGVKAVKTNGKTGEGKGELIKEVIRTYEERKMPPEVKYSQSFEEQFLNLQGGTKHEKIAKALELLGEDFERKLREERKNLIRSIYYSTVRRAKERTESLSDRLDRVFLHPIFGSLLFLLIMFLLFKVSFDFSAPWMDWLDGFMNDFLKALVIHSVGDSLLSRFLSEAVIGGVGFVLTFLPLIATMLFLISLLELSGYLPRVAFLMDGIMHKFGLHGNSFIPLLLGFGCNVPAIMATRTMESQRDKLLVMAMIPFMSCPARLVVFSFFAVLFFPNPALVIFLLYIAGILFAFLTSFALQKTFYKSPTSQLILELPPYRMPSFGLVLKLTWAHVKHFIHRAGTLIFAVSVIIWLMLNLPPGVKDTKESLAGYVGRALVPIFEPMGLEDWRITTSLIPAFLAREVVLGSMATIYAVEQEEEKGEFDLKNSLREQVIAFGHAIKDSILNTLNPIPKTFEVEDEYSQLKGSVKSSMTPAQALSFMLFILLYTSCLGTVAVLWKEAGKRFALLFLAYSFVLAWLVGVLAYFLSSQLPRG
ncbi:ferrous iron transport protein B [Thermocrinis sp.]